ncbi:DUF6907 domain-containing protein [Actinacidiphila acididurans]|uniref:Uncharacterized protein n=1 Tax=Actinacidiphila acididurans TaxID=2784346 RepID=A0ABS2TXJ3_9ACTN|nr:hypothetical protein [Actinacidiphila acididurans]MBM9508054.1 hypothetical protein [Actinacidiphila acididurans]
MSEPQRARAWVVATDTGEAVRGYLPAWASQDPSLAGVPIGELHLVLADLVLESDATGLVLPVVQGQEPALYRPVFAVTIACKPFGEDDEPCIPTAAVQIVDDFWLTGLDPGAIEALGHQLRGLADKLITHTAPMLAAARTDWAKHHPVPAPQN